MSKHQGATMNVVPELDIREVIINGLHELANDEASISEIVERVDNLRSGSQTSWAADLREELLAMLDPQSSRYFLVLVGYPSSDALLPAVSIILDSAGENASEALVGDDLGMVYTTEGTFIEPPHLDSGLSLIPLPTLPAGPAYSPPAPIRIVEEHLIGTGWSSTVQVGCWHLAPEGSLLLQAAVRWALFRGKGQLQDSGVHDVTFSEGGVAPDQRMEPRVGYVPIIRVHMDWTYRQTRRAKATPGNITLTTVITNC